jgi:phosphoglycolate phosphatase
MRSLARLVGLRRKPKVLAPLGTVRVLVFDFDGTIADTLWQGLEILNSMAEEFGFRPLAKEELPQAQDMTTRQLMKFLGIPNRKLPTIGHRGVKKLRALIGEVQPLSGMPAVLRELHARGIRMGIVTSNSEENVGIFLRNHDLEIIEFVRSSSRLLGKAREIRQAMKKHGFGAGDAIYIGDETRDVEACKRAGLRCVAVAWGYNSRRILAAQQPFRVVDTPEELLVLTDGTLARV